jgi:hypothetical protein
VPVLRNRTGASTSSALAKQTTLLALCANRDSLRRVGQTGCIGLEGEGTPFRLVCTRHEGPKPEAPVLNDLGPDDGEARPCGSKAFSGLRMPERPGLSVGVRLRSWN